jgi:hypothetical protein
LRLDGLRLLSSGILHDTVVSPCDLVAPHIACFRFDWTEPWELDPYDRPVALEPPLPAEELHVWSFRVFFGGVSAPLGRMPLDEPHERRYMLDSSPFGDDARHCHFLDERGHRTGWDLRGDDVDPVAHCRRFYDFDVVSFLSAHVESDGGGHRIRFETYPRAHIEFGFDECWAEPSDDAVFTSWLAHPFWGPRFRQLLVAS